MQKWRFVDSGSLDGSQNMAIDEALLLSFDPQISLPLLRLYGWSPPALSLGRFQKADEILDTARCRATGVPFVRRITGGGVIYHADEITYSMVCAPDQIPAVSSIKDSFRILTGFLLQFYRRLGLRAAYAIDVKTGAERLGERTTYCFAGKETFDILLDGRKIGGNAQRRIKQVIFQHGSIPLLSRFEEGARFLREYPSGLEQRVTSLSDEGVMPDSEFLKGRLKEAFSASLGVLLVDEPLRADERELAARLRSEKYSQSCWNLHGEVL